MRPHKPERRAAAAVEFAIIAPILFFIVLATIEVGRGIMVSEYLSSAARVGARKAAMNGSDSTTTTEVSTSINNALTYTGGGITYSDVTKTYKLNDTTVSNFSAAKPGDRVSVQLSIPFANVSWSGAAKFMTGTNANVKSKELTMLRQ